MAVVADRIRTAPGQGDALTEGDSSVLAGSASCGLRVSEAIALQRRHVHVDGARPHVKIRRAIVKRRVREAGFPQPAVPHRPPCAAPGGAQEICPAPLSAVEADALARCALEVHVTLGFDGAAAPRIDFLRDLDGKFVCLEANPLPGLTPCSLLPLAAGAAGTSMAELCDELVRRAVQRVA
jgi:hypothetical protein